MSNGHSTNAIISGTIIVSDSITFTNVYHIPSFIVNLIYVTQLKSASDFFLTFHIDKCLILQILSQKMIGLTKIYGDLYILNAQTLSCKPFPASSSSYHASSILDNNANL